MKSESGCAEGKLGDEAAGEAKRPQGIRGIHHLALRTKCFEALRSFYEDRLGLLRIREQEGHSIWLRAGETLLMLERAGEGEPGPPEGSLELLAFALSAKDRDALAAQLHQNGISLEARTEQTLYYRDPEGRRVALSSYAWDKP